jgi:hypothetical protein
MSFLGSNANLLSFEKFRPFDLKTSFSSIYLKERYAARASFETCFCSLVGRLVFFSFLFGRSCFRLDIVEVLFIEVASDVCFFPNSCDWEVILEVWEDMW